MADIAGIPYVEARFTDKGQLQNAGEVVVPPGTTDLIVISHGWNNDAEDARALYKELFTNVVAVRPPDAARTCAILGVIWPSKKFDELVATSGTPGDGQGAASIDAAHGAASRAVIDQTLSRLKTMFDAPDQQRTLEEARALVPDLDDKATARRAFADKVRSLLDPSAANREDASDTFFKTDGNELMQALKISEDDLGDDVAEANGSASLPLSVGSVEIPVGGAASLGSTLAGFAASALNLLNYTTYYTMKTRAGAVGKAGVAPLVDRLAPQVQRIHLIGHSFGGRVVAATAAGTTTDKLASLTLLQAAFSHNGFSQAMHGVFRSVIDQRRVRGPILITHTKNDRAVGVAYPLASRINGDTTAAFGDENDKFGGMGRNGAQQMLATERVAGTLLAVAAPGYHFQAGTCVNLLADQFIKSHGDVRGREVAYAIACAIG